MQKIPTSTKQYLSNARYYLKAADQFPSPTRDAVKILLLLTARENITIAEEELHAWAQRSKPAKDLYRSHAYKLRNSSSIDRIILGTPGDQAITTSYKSGKDLEKLHQICRYGLKKGCKDLSSIFARGWDSDTFERALIRKIDWEEMMVKIYENLPDYGK